MTTPPPPPEARIDTDTVLWKGSTSVAPGAIIGYNGTYFVAVEGSTTAPNGPAPPPLYKGQIQLVWMPAALVVPPKKPGRAVAAVRRDVAIHRA